MTADEPAAAEKDKPLSTEPHPQEQPFSTAAEKAISKEAIPKETTEGLPNLYGSHSSSAPTNDVPVTRNLSLQQGNNEDNHATAIVEPTEGVSQWSHQTLAPKKDGPDEKPTEEEWQEMPAYAPYDIYDDDNKLVAREAHHIDDGDAYEGLGGAGKGYTRVQIDEDARSATSMDDNTSYLFKHKTTDLMDDEEEQRDPLAQMQATKDLLTEGQRIAYVGVTRLAMSNMVKELDIEGTKGTKKELRVASESIKMWSQQMMVRLYAHMDINSSGNNPTPKVLPMKADYLQNKS